MCSINKSLLPCGFGAFPSWFVSLGPKYHLSCTDGRWFKISLGVGASKLPLPSWSPPNSFIFLSLSTWFCDSILSSQKFDCSRTSELLFWGNSLRDYNNHFVLSMACRLRSTCINFKTHRSFHLINSSKALISCSVASSTLANFGFKPPSDTLFRH